ncbi:MAG TPA: hypothetical protein VFG73_02405 [Rhodanobacteraceae bacterium]|nr:hypothetical protein [Rhodanobacteraceae bacterium]
MTIRERPIMFSGPQVRAILDCRMTQTRRVVRGAPTGPDSYFLGVYKGVWGIHEHLDAPAAFRARCPYGTRGDRLWVREAWSVDRFEPCEPHERDWQDLHSPVVRYAADDATRRVEGNRQAGHIYHGPVSTPRPLPCMPRWLSRITLEITDLRVERLQTITEDDARAEGCLPPVEADGSVTCGRRKTAFREQWDAALAKKGHGWEVNPWVWVVEFRVLEVAA